MQNRSEMIERQKVVLETYDNCFIGGTMYLMGMLSDIQEMIARGMNKEAIAVANDIKTIIDNRIAKKDEHGRHL